MSHYKGPVLLLAFFLFTGCGAQSFSAKKRLANVTSVSPGNPVTYNFPTATTSTTSTTTTSPSTATTGIPPMAFRVGGVGYSTQTIDVQVNRVLKMKFTPGLQDGTATGTGYVPQYSRLGIYVSVGTSSKATEMLDNGLTTGMPESSSVLDFSSNFTKACASTDTSCRQSVTITVSKPNYDYWCIKWMMYCPWTRVESTHPWNGTLTIQTDDTDPL